MDMYEKIRAGMLEATRLVGKGDLRDATQLIQRALQGRSTPDAAAGTADPTPVQGENAPIEGTFRVVDDVVEPASNTQHAHKDSAKQPFANFDWSKAQQWAEHFKPAPGVFSDPSPTVDVDGNGQFVSASYTNQAGTRAYKLYIPSNYHGQKLPLVVMLHGCTQNPDDFAAGTRMNALAEQEQCFVVYPAQTNTANKSKCWNWFEPADQQRDQGEPSIIAGITREVMSRYSIDPQRVYVAGLSAGGAMATTMGITYPDLYAATAVHSGLPYGSAHDLPSAFMAMQGNAAMLAGQHGTARSSEKCQRIVPTIVFHGDRDAKVHPQNGDRVIAQWTEIHGRNGKHFHAKQKPRVKMQHGQVPNGHAYSRAIFCDMDGQSILEQWKIHGAGHAWSGGSPAGSHTDAKGPDATREMLRFFYEHPHPAT